MQTALRLLATLLLFFAFQQCTVHHPTPLESEEGEGGLMHLRDQYFDLLHRAKPGVDWRKENERVMLETWQAMSKHGTPDGSQSFAGGKIKGAWFERGSNNQAGSMLGLDYVPATNKLYSISDAGTLWRRSLDVNDWTNLNRDLRFSNRQIQVIPGPSGGQRILTVIGKKVMYSDNEGATFTEATGWNFYDGWGGPIQLVAANNGNSVVIYYTVLTWDATPWAPRVQLYYSINRGQSFTLITTFTHGESGQVSMWHPYGTGECYLLNQSSKVYKLNLGSLTPIGANTSLPTGVDCQLRGHRSSSGFLTFYALTDNQKIWRSTNNGISWTLRSSLPADSKAWSVGIEVSLSDPNKLFYGNIDCYRSYDGGATWTLVNNWWEYYGNVPAKLHADIMDIEFYRNGTDQEFALISNHGGVAVSYDQIQTTTNLSLTGLNVSQYYSVRTDPLNPTYVYAGAQDQGYQRASTAVSSPNGALDFTQIVSGDYGQMVFSGNGAHFWKQYPGGSMTYHQVPQTSTSWSDSGWDLTGDNKPNVGWMVPTAEFSDDPVQNKILIGGGNINGGPGSYLIELAADTTDPFTITAIQDPFDFKANSTNGNSLISAIAVNPLNGRRYVSTDDGAFYRKDVGGTWTKATGFSGPGAFYLYGACILPSRLNPDLVWFSGSGYSNAAVWKSADGGKTFTAMATGLPATVVQAMAVSPDEKLLFAATDAGPFVYVFENSTWYPLRDPSMPYQSIFSVEYIASRHLVRFGTFGRGIWDLGLDDLAIDGVSYPSACDPSSGEIALKSQNGLAPLKYAWSNGATTANLTGLPAGNYTVTVTDANGFTQTKSFAVGGMGKPAKPYNLTTPATGCGTLHFTWQGPVSGSYQLRYRQGNAVTWTVLNNIGNVQAYTLQLNQANGLNYEYAVRYVCPNNRQSAWVGKSGVMKCNEPDPRDDSNAGAAQVVQASSMAVYPNPASDLVHVRFDHPPTGPVIIRLYDNAGRMVRYLADQAVDADGLLTFSVSGLSNGVYWVATGEGRTAKIIVATF